MELSQQHQAATNHPSQHVEAVVTAFYSKISTQSWVQSTSKKSLCHSQAQNFPSPAHPWVEPLNSPMPTPERPIRSAQPWQQSQLGYQPGAYSWILDLNSWSLLVWIYSCYGKHLNRREGWRWFRLVRYSDIRQMQIYGIFGGFRPDRSRICSNLITHPQLSTAPVRLHDHHHLTTYHDKSSQFQIPRLFNNVNIYTSPHY